MEDRIYQDALIRVSEALLLDPGNRGIELPLVFTGPENSKAYFTELNAFVKLSLGESVADRYRIIIDDAAEVGRYVGRVVRDVRKQRRRDGDAYYFNWLLNVPRAHQTPFEVNHENVCALNLSRDLPAHELAVNLRRAFSAVVTGNVKDHGIRMIASEGPFEIRADKTLAEALDRLLRQFVIQGRMKLAGVYEPCYRVVAA